MSVDNTISITSDRSSLTNTRRGTRFNRQPWFKWGKKLYRVKKHGRLNKVITFLDFIIDSPVPMVTITASKYSILLFIFGDVCKGLPFITQIAIT